MSLQEVVEKILSDGEDEARLIESKAKKEANETVEAAKKRAEEREKQCALEASEKARLTKERSAASARLECAKIALFAKRKAMDGIYALAKERLISLSKEDTLSLFAHLLESYAEKGDTVVLPEKFAYKDDVKTLPVVEKKGLKISQKGAKIDGGFYLVGETADRNLSFDEILSADREKWQSAIAKEAFKEN